MGKEEKYTKDSIKVLDDISHIRQRSGMYIGDATDPRHLFSEALDNALDEIQNGYGDSVKVVVDTKENSYKIEDNGRGIPQGEKTLEDGSKIETVKLVCTKSFAGGKFNNGDYALRSGLNGLGLTIINALSKTLTIISHRDGKKVLYETSNDLIKREKIKKNIHGTSIIFIPDEQYFQSPTIPKEHLIERCRIANAFGMKTSLVIDDKEIDVSASMTDLLPQDSNDVKIYQDLPLISSSDNNHSEHLEILIRYTSDTSDRYRGYTNLLYNSLGGTHVNITSTKIIVDAWEEVIKRLRIKTEVPLRRYDYLVGLRCVVASFISNPEFSSQTKEKLTTPKKSLEDFATNCQKKLVKLLCESPGVSKALVKRFEEYRLSQNRLLARKEISSLIKVNNDDPDNIRRRSVVSKLVECTSKRRDNTELFLVEGDSACLRWNTKIRLANDTEATIKDVCDRVSNGEEIYVYGKAPYGEPYYGPNVYKVLAGGITKRNALLYRVYFDNGTYVDCTEDHKFMTIRRKFKELKDLTPNDSLSVIGYHCDCFKPTGEGIYRLVYKKYVGEIPDGYVIHHKDKNHFNNYPSNLELKLASDHTIWHNEDRTKNGNFDSWLEHVGDATPLVRYWKNDENKRLKSEEVKHWFNNPESGEYNRNRTSERTKLGMSKMTKEQHRDRLYLQSYNVSLAYYKDLIFYRKLFDIDTIFDKDKLKEQRRKDGNIRASGMYLYPNTFMSKYSIDSKEELLELIKNANHRITKVECLNIYEDVYDIEVDEVHNYCLANDIIVHNCAPYLSARNKELQAILPLRGKILNVTYKDVKDAIKNKEICDIANSVGAGIGANCDASKSRYEKIIISADSDEDGRQINCLVLSVFVNMFPDLVKQGRVFLTTPPLYCWGDSIKNYGWCNDIKDVPKNIKNVHRFKGLGEMNTDQLEFFLVNPETRNLIQVEYPTDIDKFNRILGTSIGKHELMIELGIIEES